MDQPPPRAQRARPARRQAARARLRGGRAVDYNRESAAESDRVRDFLVLHYAISERPEAFWRAAAAATLPGSLEHTLGLFRERGRLPLYEEETFSRHGWAAVLLGQGAIPRRVDPLIDTGSADQSDQAMAHIRGTIEAMIPALPTHGDYLRQLSARGTR
ncbi:MAG: tryptophan 7-halogenase [Sphingomonas sp.]